MGVLFNKFTSLATAACVLTACGKKQDEGKTPASEVKPEAPLVLPNIPKEPIYHIVKKGNSLSEIARSYGVSLEALKKENGLKKDTIFEGQKLKIPMSGLSNVMTLSQSGTHASSSSLELFHSLSGNIPALDWAKHPAAIDPILVKTNAALIAHAVRTGIPRKGPALCGMGSCNAFDGIKETLSWLQPADSLFADSAVYLATYGSNSRDAVKMEEVLRKLSESKQSGWVRVRMRNIPLETGVVQGWEKEGAQVLPSNLPITTLVLYQPDPKLKGVSGTGGKGFGHVEFHVKRNNSSWYIHAAFTPVHGGSPFCRSQFRSMMERDASGKFIHPEPDCSAYILVPLELKEQWLKNCTGSTFTSNQ